MEIDFSGKKNRKETLQYSGFEELDVGLGFTKLAW